MPWSVKESEPFLLKGEVQFCELSCFSILSLFGDDVRDSSLLPCLHLILNSILPIPKNLLLINLLEFLEYIASESGFPSIHVTDEYNICILFSQKTGAKIFGGIPLLFHERLQIDFWVALPDHNFLFFLNHFPFGYWLLFGFSGVFLLLIIIFRFLLIIFFRFLLLPN